MLGIDSLDANESRTFVIPTPGGRTRINHDSSSASAFFSIPDEALSSSSALLRAANPLLNMIYQVRTLVHNSDPSQLRNYLIEEVKKFERRAKEDAIPPGAIAAAQYCLCTVIDETAAQTPWGGGGVWAKYSLLVTFYNETWGGEKFFQILARVTQTPSAHGDLIELMFFCISLGFEGRYKIVPNGKTQLELLRLRLAEIIADLKGDKERYLSPHWQGIVKPRAAIWTILPIWVSFLFCSILAASAFVFFTFQLSDHSDRVFSKILQTPIPTFKEKVAAVPADGRITRLFQQEIAQKLVRVNEEAVSATVTLMGDGLFASGSALLNPAYVPVIDKVSEAIKSFGKDTLISGYTDNIPIRSARFPSNWHLSVERARAVAAKLDPGLALKVQGLGEAEPLMPNDTSEGRAFNRRVEIKILLKPVQ